jgi:hypothetical protein
LVTRGPVREVPAGRALTRAARACKHRKATAATAATVAAAAADELRIQGMGAEQLRQHAEHLCPGATAAVDKRLGQCLLLKHQKSSHTADTRGLRIQVVVPHCGKVAVPHWWEQRQ